MEPKAEQCSQRYLDFGINRQDWPVVVIGFAAMMAIAIPVGYLLGAIKPHLPTALAGGTGAWEALLKLVKEPLETSFFEELFFRALIFGWMAKRLPLEAAAILSTLIFGLTHIPAGLAMVVFATVLGYILAKAYARTKRIMVPVIIHYLVILAGSFLL
ncbi:MAG TPA: CPBP family intramembrane metalloprotease [Firmicutes bacterium]|nr:CPBP family intramembrane metalloprotease [Bacillota bacterium]